jgi:hypothetical protein
LDLLHQQKITPIIAQRLPLAEARHAITRTMSSTEEPVP